MKQQTARKRGVKGSPGDQPHDELTLLAATILEVMQSLGKKEGTTVHSRAVRTVSTAGM